MEGCNLRMFCQILACKLHGLKYIDATQRQVEDHESCVTITKRYFRANSAILRKIFHIYGLGE